MQHTHTRTLKISAAMYGHESGVHTEPLRIVEEKQLPHEGRQFQVKLEPCRPSHQPHDLLADKMMRYRFLPMQSDLSDIDDSHATHGDASRRRTCSSKSICMMDASRSTITPPATMPST